MTKENIEKFRTIILKGIDIREKALFPENPLYALPLDLNGEEIVQREQALLKCLLTQFDKLFLEDHE